MLTPEEEQTIEEQISRLIYEDSMQTQFVPTGSLLQLFGKLKEAHNQNVQDIKIIATHEESRLALTEEVERLEKEVKRLKDQHSQIDIMLSECLQKRIELEKSVYSLGELLMEKSYEINQLQLKIDQLEGKA